MPQVSVHITLNSFHDHKILIVKEEANTSLLNQVMISMLRRVTRSTFTHYWTSSADASLSSSSGLSLLLIFLASCRLSPLMHGRPHSRGSISILTFVFTFKTGLTRSSSTWTQGRRTFNIKITFGSTPSPLGGAT
jgi:hypothetical protein